MTTKRSSKRTVQRRAPRRPAASRPDPLDRCVNLFDLEAIARRKMAPGCYDYFAGGAEDERTMSRNREGMDQFVFLPRVLVDASQLRTSTTVLGAPVAMPILLAPAAYHCLAHEDGEVATARAAGAAGSLMTLSTFSTRSLEEVAAVGNGPLWFQLYMTRDRSITERLVERAQRAGYRALVLTVDVPLLGRRERDLRAGFRLPDHVTIANLKADGHELAGAYQDLSRFIGDQVDPSLTWEVVEWLRSVTSMPVVLKGIMRPDDAARAVEAGAAGVWVSNHGGRQLDAAQATILALPAVVEAVAGRAEVYVDGGFRRGTDVLKALALGARAAFIGRPYLWGLAAGGEKGVTRALALLRVELETAMGLAGATDATAIDRSIVVRA